MDIFNVRIHELLSYSCHQYSEKLIINWIFCNHCCYSCSLKCWNVHRDQKCEKFQQEDIRVESTLEHYQFKTEDTVPFETLKLLGKSLWRVSDLLSSFIRHLSAFSFCLSVLNVQTLFDIEQSEGVRATLYNPHVRSILNVIDKSQNPSSALKVAMLEPIFVQFVEECLKIIEPVPDVSGYEF